MSSNDSWETSEQRLNLLRKIALKKTLEQLILEKIESSPISLRDLLNQIRNNSPSKTISEKKLKNEIKRNDLFLLYRSHVPLSFASPSKTYKPRYVGLSNKISNELLGNVNEIQYLCSTHYFDLKSNANGRI